MKVYWALLILVVVVGFSFIGLMIYSGVPHEKTETIYLNATNTKGAYEQVLDSTKFLNLISIYYCNKANKLNNPVPWADIYVCQVLNKRDTSKADTVLILDSRTDEKGYNLKYSIESYEIELKETRTFKTCKIVIPENQKAKFRRYHYKYAEVTLVNDD